MDLRRKRWDLLDIPEGTRGKFAIQHTIQPAGHVESLANGRTAILGGDQLGTVTFANPTRWHALVEDVGIWMTDRPIEQVQCDRALRGVRGMVLVGGLGLGYAATVLALRRSVTRVVVVEKAPQVVVLVSPHLARREKAARAKLEFVTADLFKYLLKTPMGQFDYGFYDIWASDGEGTFHETVVPLRRLSAGKVGRVVCWNEHIMRGQLRGALQGRMMSIKLGLERVKGKPCTVDDFCERTGSVWIDWSVPFFRWVRDAKPAPNVAEAGVAAYAKMYEVAPLWESLWDVWRQEFLGGLGRTR